MPSGRILFSGRFQNLCKLFVLGLHANKYLLNMLNVVELGHWAGCGRIGQQHRHRQTHSATPTCRPSHCRRISPTGTGFTSHGPCFIFICATDSECPPHPAGLNNMTNATTNMALLFEFRNWLACLLRILLLGVSLSRVMEC